MPTHNLSKIFQPRSVALIGASERPGSVGRTVLENLQRTGSGSQIFPINPKHSSLLGLTAYPSIGAVPHPPDLAIIATPAETVPSIVHDCGEAGVPGIIILSAGFGEVGRQGREIEAGLVRNIAKFPDMRVIGPNCLGVMVPGSRLNASFAAGMAKPGRVAFISQSGALCTSILDWSLSEEIGFSYFVSIGNALNVKIGDLIDYLAEDPTTDSIVLYLESVTDSRRFMSAARAFTRTKPIVVYKAGRFTESAKAAASHTGAMAGVDAVYEAAFHRAGMVRVYRAEDMFDCAGLLARQRTPAGPRLAIITNAGGPGVMAADELLEHHGVLATLSPETIDKLNTVLPEHWSRQNPVDVLGDARPERFAKALEIVVADDNVDGVLVVLTPQAMTDPMATAIRVADVAAGTREPILAAWMGGQSVEPGRQILNQAGVPTYDSPDRAVRSFTYLVAYRRNREVLYETPRQVPLHNSVDLNAARVQIDEALTAGRDTLTEIESKALLGAFGIPTTIPQPAYSAAGAAQIAGEVGYPVAIKINSPQILHKTEVQGVVLGVATDDEVQQVFKDMVERAKRLRPDADVHGVTLQPMLTAAEGIELIIGAKKDPVFGAVMMVGAGGVTAEVLGDVALELPPLNERLARRMIDSLRIKPLLYGFRGRHAVNIDKLIEVLMRFSYLISENPSISELDVNPLLVTADGATALDARVILDRRTAESKPRPYSHLAIRPYPEEYIRDVTLKDGTNVLLRPIRPEDEPLWHEHLKHCSQRSIWQRFRYLFKKSTHEMATRFCFVDYDRTMAIVAEIERNDQREIIGVARLVADADHRSAEFAILLADEWQGRGLGNILTDYAFEICSMWGINRVYAETTIDNQPMQKILRRQNFKLTKASDGEALYECHLSERNEHPACSSTGQC
ncbi:MAG TPA: bifunctional acetate--CoA ligase family protein/GNAT family N-acetyltransferase [Lacipirellulaceae bacterium]|nr:bifunctional acetate--CoA ligase family protein/GNAT family N-acetyltransferase [Lacipirellulaceae bacterium]